jgi:hypothetical protein
MLNLRYKNQLGLYWKLTYFVVRIIRNTNRQCRGCVVKVFHPCAVKAYRGVEVYLHSVLTSTLGGV